MARKLYSSLLFSLFLGFYASVTFFSHNHILNGVTIVHSHPFKSADGDNPAGHRHTQKSFSIIQLLSTFAADLLSAHFSLALFLILIFKIIVSIKDNDNLTPHANYAYVLRGPPVKHT